MDQFSQRWHATVNKLFGPKGEFQPFVRLYQQKCSRWGQGPMPPFKYMIDYEKVGLCKFAHLDPVTLKETPPDALDISLSAN